ncbi:DUF892 family protein [Gemmata palustris]|uniref:DUF892 family protein n=1 Tax=Gemmata palustris TaxID=2822762 RepID=UPI0028F3FE82|nr:DUF892 family protein [Gemmata palustris]
MAEVPEDGSLPGRRGVHDRRREQELPEEVQARDAVTDCRFVGTAFAAPRTPRSNEGSTRAAARVHRADYPEAEVLLQETLDEEKEADEKLNELAETVINVEAQEAEGDGEDDTEEEEPEEDEPAPAPQKGKAAPKAGGKK